MDYYINLAKYTIKQYLKLDKIIDAPEDLPEQMIDQRAGVFVSFKNKGQLRGCIGTLIPTQKNIAEEIIRNAIDAATQDPRFLPITFEELPQIKASVDVLSKPIKVDKFDINNLDPKEFGVLIKSKDKLKSGLLLPNLEGIDTVNEQIEIACQKAGIDKITEDFEVYKFTVERHEEK